MAQQILYPIGIQAFSEIRTKNYFYVDKTEYVYKMANGAPKYLFLNRPRRFGKSLLVSTLAAYFRGQRELFEGLAIDNLETEWTEYPVLHFSMASGKFTEKKQLEDYLANMLSRMENEYGITNPATLLNLRLKNLIRAAYKNTGRQVVVLIDEYDAPLLDVVHEDEQLPVLRNVMRNFYSPLKDCDPYLRFVFLTGITKFSQLSIFSELNNIKNISMLSEYAGVCGITKEEMLTQMTEGINRMAEEQGMTYDGTVDALTKMYDGYHFAWPSPDVFNPYSLLNAFADRSMKAYWFSSGTPTYLIEMMRKYQFLPTALRATVATADDFDTPTQTMRSMMPLLYQSGYFTIKDYDRTFDEYTLDVPNKEVRIGLVRSLIPEYIMPDPMPVNNIAVSIARCLYKDDIDGALRTLQTFLTTVPYCDNTHYEGHWQQVLYIIFSLLGNYCDVEVHTATGRIDLVLVTKTRMYIIETKTGKAPSEAMRQINLNEYDKRFALYTLPTTKVAITFDTDRHTLAGWEIEE